MTTRRQWRGNLSAMRAEKRQAVDQYPARRFPIEHEIQKLEDELNAFNERIEELEKRPVIQARLQKWSEPIWRRRKN